MKNTNLTIFCAGFLLLSCAWAHGQALTRYVSPYGSHTDPYTDWTTAATTVWAAVSAANSNDAGDTVWITNGTYVLDATIVVSNVQVRGWSGDPADVIVDGDGSVRCFHLAHGGTRLSCLTVTNGRTTGDADPAVSAGAGIYVSVKDVVISNCVVTGNSTEYLAGGIQLNHGTGNTATRGTVYVYDTHVIGNTRNGINNGPDRYSDVLVKRCHIGRNSSRGINTSFGNVVIEDCYIYENVGYGVVASETIHIPLVIKGTTVRANQGIGIYKFRGFLYVSDSVIEYNTNSAWGAGIASRLLREIIVSNSVIRGNSAQGGSGGGLRPIEMTYSNSAHFYNTLITDNSASTAGGGVLLYQAAWPDDSAAFYNCTIVDNRSQNDSAGVRTTASGILFYNSIVYSNKVVSSAGEPDYTVANTIFHYSCAPDLPDEDGNITDYPEFVDIGSGDFRLQRTSPCINAGTNQPWMIGAVDLDGNKRIDGFWGQVDIGAYEYLPKGALFNLR